MINNPFVKKRDELNLDKHIVVKYRIQTPGDFLDAVTALAKEQSFSCIDDKVKEKELIERFSAKVIKESLVEIREEAKPAIFSYIYSKKDGPFYTREVELAFPIELIGDSLVLLYDTVIGEIHNIAKFTGIKVLDIEFPKHWQQLYNGPVFGIEGIRKILGKKTRTLTYQSSKTMCWFDTRRVC